MIAAKQLLSSGLQVALRSLPGFGGQSEQSRAAVTPGPVLVSSSKFLVKLLETRHEYMRVQKLRYDVFHREFRKKKFPFGLDRDRYDSEARHLIVIERESGRIVGSYRSILSNDPNALYTASEFDISQFTAIASPKLELSRACIHKDFRTGAVLTLLWRGIGEYMNRTRADWLFGIPSIKSTDVDEAVEIYRYFMEMDRITTHASVSPLATHQLPDFAQRLAAAKERGPLDLAKAAARIPPLFHVYVKAGARIAGEPALDREFQCIDFFIALKLDEMSQAFKRKYIH